MQYYEPYLKYLKDCKLILDTGCGKGEFVDEMNKRGYKCIGCDIAPKRKGIIKVDLNKPLPFKSEVFDAVTCFHVLEHLKEPLKFIEEVRRILKPRGIFIIATPHFMNKTAWIDFQHIRPYCYYAFEFLKGWEIIDRGFQMIRYPHKTWKAKLYHKILNPFANRFPILYETIFGYWFGGPEEVYAILRKL